MARGRMVSRTIVRHGGVAALGNELGGWADSFHCRLIAFLDANGNVAADPHYLKGTVMPRVDACGANECEAYRDALIRHGLAVGYEVDGLPYLHFPAFRENQVGLRPDRENSADFCPLPSGWDAEARTIASNPPEGIRQSSGKPLDLLRIASGSPPEAIPQTSGSPPEAIPQTSGSPPEAIPQVSVNLPHEVEVEVEEKDTTTTTTTSAGAGKDSDSDEAFIDRVIRLANKGMSENPALHDPKPISAGHSSRQNVHDWLGAGVARSSIERTVYSTAKSFRPQERRRQITTMAYFDNPVHEAWEQVRALTTETPDVQQPAAPHAARPGKYAHLVER